MTNNTAKDVESNRSSEVSSNSKQNSKHKKRKGNVQPGNVLKTASSTVDKIAEVGKAVQELANEVDKEIEIAKEAVKEQESSGISFRDDSEPIIIENVNDSSEKTNVFVKRDDLDDKDPEVVVIEPAVKVSSTYKNEDDVAEEKADASYESDDNDTLDPEQSESNEQASYEFYAPAGNAEKRDYDKVVFNDQIEQGNRWFSRLLLLAVLIVCVVAVVNFLRGGIGSDVNDSSDHVDAYAKHENMFQEIQDAEKKEDSAVEKLVKAEENLVKKDTDDEDDTTDNSEAGDDVEQTRVSLNEAFKTGKVSAQDQERISALIAKESVESGINPELLASIIMAESYFNPKAVSKAGKRGLMQITPKREAQILILRDKGEKPGDLFNPEYNMKLGTWYLKYLLNKYDGNLSKALVAYCWDERVLQNILDGAYTAPHSTGLYFSNIQRYFNQLSAKTGKRLVLSLPKAERNLPEKVDSIKVNAEATIENESDEVWERAIKSVGKRVSPETKAEIISVIKEQSLIYDMDPAFISAVITAESAFDPLTVSERGKRGLFQLEPKWAKVVAATMGVTWQGKDALFEPAYNIELGVAYLQHLKLLFDGDAEKALLAFTLTPYRLSRILAGKKPLPKSAPIHVANVKKYCEAYGCETEISGKYVERLGEINAK